MIVIRYEFRQTLQTHLHANLHVYVSLGTRKDSIKEDTYPGLLNESSLFG